MRTTRALRGLAAAAALALTTSACGIGGMGSTDPATTAPVERAPELRPDQQVSIVFESYNFGQAGAWTDTFNELIDEFQQQHPNITVTAQKPQGNSPNPVSDTVSSVQNQLLTGNPPDVAQLGFSELDFTVNQLRAKPLDDLVGREAVQANFDGPGHAYDRSARTLGDWEGKTYGVPFVFSTPVLYYNATLFQQAGLDPAKPPATWAEVERAGLAIKAATGKDGAYSDCLTEATKDWCFQSMVRSNGGRVLSADRKSLTFADPASVEVVEAAQQMVRSGATPVLGQRQAYEGFGRGEMGMILESSSLQGNFEKAARGKWDLRAAPMPGFDGKATVPTNSGAALFVLSEDPAKQRASWELIKFLTSPEAYQLIATKIGYLPLRTGLLGDPAGLKPWAEQNPLVQPNIEQLARLEPWVSMPGVNYQQIRDGMMAAVEKSVYQGADPEATLREAQERASGLLPKG
ncbi:ABC transporter substrate-binding protein [Saccharopolyspora indica]|uniref:ABC transporter substrate-binding protein n=1 Tax=Saccharopolyspora indica TaxID=1229659 RepID=UPI0022EA902C|nr:ABC transporter substrate-binding protein [Saccharopolyspora indica]MDA3648393.1 ABC transporter substrate-binding protein [Saccharopolyspora indica]